MARGDLTDQHWQRLEPLLPPQKPHTGRPNEDHRKVINGILWILRTGAPWRDLPKGYGKQGTVSSRFYRWRAAGIGSSRPSKHRPTPKGASTGRFTTSMAPRSGRISTPLEQKKAWTER